MKRLIELVLIAFFPAMALLMLLNVSWWENQLPDTRAAVLFIERLAAGDMSAAKSMSTGEVLGRLSGRNEIPPPARVVESQVGTLARGDGWTEVFLAVETEDDSGTVDMQWYHLGLRQEAEQWKVYRMQPESPDLGIGLRWGANRDDLQDVRQVLWDYLDNLAANRYAEAGKLLVGPARTAHQAAASILSGAPVIKDVGEINMEPLLKRGKSLVMQAEYQVDGRQAKVILLFYLTSKGWRIAEVSQT